MTFVHWLSTQIEETITLLIEVASLATDEACSNRSYVARHVAGAFVAVEVGFVRAATGVVEPMRGARLGRVGRATLTRGPANAPPLIG